MKKLLSALICFVFMAAVASLQVSAIGEELYASVGTPAIDGIVDGVWGTAQRDKFNYCVAGDISDGRLPGSCSAYVSALHDAEAIYFLLEVNDNDYIFGGEGEYGSDEIRIYIDEIDWFDTTWRFGQVCLIITPDENGKVEVIGDVSESTTVAYSKASDSKRYIEVKYVPTHYDIADEKPLLVDFRFNDVYEDANGEIDLAFGITWSDELNEGDIDSSNWSYLKFGSGSGSGEGFSNAEEAARSIGQPLIKDYEYVSGSGTWGYDGERARNLFDGDVGTKFCTPEMPASAIMKLDGKFLITGLVMATANDTASYSDRNPDDWVIEGSVDSSKWTVITKGDNSFFDATNFTYYAQKIECDGEGYRFIRFTNKKSGGDLMQLSEVQVCGIKSNSSQEAIDALLNPVEVEPIPAEDAIFLPISKSSLSGGINMEAIAAPTEPDANAGGFNSDVAVTVIVISIAAVLVVVCAVIAVIQSKQKRQNIL